MRRAALALGLALAGCSVSFDHTSGRTACGTAGLCPDGLSCQLATNLCVDPSLIGTAENGAACTAGTQCRTGACVDGVCCDRLCDGQCESCSAATPGQCALVTGEPVGGRAACGGEGVCAGTCDGTAPTCAFPAVECVAASCEDGVATAQAMCASGTCPAPTTLTCSTTVDTKLCGATTCAGVVDVVAANAHTCAMMSDGSVWCWGLNFKGVLGVPPLADEIVRKPFRSPALTGVKKLFSSPFLWHWCGIFDGDVVKCWGDNRYGQLGLGTTDDVPHPVPMAPLLADGVTPLTGVKDVAGGTYHTCAIKTDRSVVCWGRGLSGRLGDADATEHNVNYATSALKPPGTVADRIAAGEDHTCIMTDGLSSMWCWGTNGSGECGVDKAATNPVTTAMVAFGPNGYDGTLARPMALANGASCAIDSGTVLCFGSQGDFGLLGRGDSANSVFSDHTAVSVCKANTATCSSTDKLSGVTSLAMGEIHACAVADQAVKCWGDGNAGQQGTGNFNSANYAGNGPVFPLPVTRITAGQYHSCAILSDRTIRCWGRNRYGDLGIPSDVDSMNVPVAPVW